MPTRIWVLIAVLCCCLNAHAAPEKVAAKASPGAWLGVMLGQSENSSALSRNLDQPGGVEIQAIIEEGPAERAGLRNRDVVLSVNGEPVSTPQELIQRIRGLRPGGWITIEGLRRDEPFDLRVRLDERPENTMLRPRRGWIGLEAIDLPPTLREHFGAPAEAGVMISHIEPGSPAEAAGYRLGDVIFTFDGEPVRSTEELKAHTFGSGVGNEVPCEVMRDGVILVIESVVERAPTSDPQARPR